MDHPNGLAFSLDERLLYVCDTGTKDMSVFDVADDGALTGRRHFATCTNGGFDGFRLDEDGRIWTSAGDGVHVYDPDGTLIGKVLVPETVANVAWGWPKRNRLYICATTSLYAILLPVRRSEDDVAMIDLHVHFPMRLLGGVESPRDVIKGMTGARAGGGQAARGGARDRRAAVQFPRLGRTWRVTPELLEQGEVSDRVQRALPAVQRDGPRRALCGAARERVLPEADRAARGDRGEVARTGGVMVRTAADLDKHGQRYVHCIEGGFHLGATPEEVTANVHELADRGVLYITLAHLFWRRVAANTPALPVPPGHGL